jgi:hypothetical protein
MTRRVMVDGHLQDSKAMKPRLASVTAADDVPAMRSEGTLDAIPRVSRSRATPNRIDRSARTE